jgi:hypothetical protein
VVSCCLRGAGPARRCAACRATAAGPQPATLADSDLQYVALFVGARDADRRRRRQRGAGWGTPRWRRSARGSAQARAAVPAHFRGTAADRRDGAQRPQIASRCAVPEPSCRRVRPRARFAHATLTEHIPFQVRVRAVAVDQIVEIPTLGAGAPRMERCAATTRGVPECGRDIDRRAPAPACVRFATTITPVILADHGVCSLTR